MLRFREFTPPARLYLLAVFVSSLAGSIFHLALNFYLETLKFDRRDIGIINAAAPGALVVAGLLIGRVSDRLGRGRGLLLGATLGLTAILGLSLSSTMTWLVAFAACRGIAEAMVGANSAPFMAEHSAPEHRVHLFAFQAAVMTATGLFGNVVGGHLPDWYSAWWGLAPKSPEAFRVTLLTGAGIYSLSLVPFAIIGLRRETPPSRDTERLETGPVGRLFFKLLLPHAIVGLGAGMTMPFLNLYVQGKFHIDVEHVGYLFGFSSVLTAAGMLVQPWVAHRFGKVAAIQLTQAVSIPFLLVLGFCPVFWLVAVAMLIRNMLMNMASPIYSAFSMEIVPRERRATFSVAAMMAWNSGWAISTAVSGVLQRQLGPETGFNIAFGAMAGLYVTSIVVFHFFFQRKRR